MSASFAAVTLSSAILSVVTFRSAILTVVTALLVSLSAFTVLLLGVPILTEAPMVIIKMLDPLTGAAENIMSLLSIAKPSLG